MRLAAFLALALAAPASAGAEPTAAPRIHRLSLAEAVRLALEVDPLVAESKIADDRSKLGVLRAQLDRVSLKIDGQIQELWNKSNIGGGATAGHVCVLGPTLGHTQVPFPSAFDPLCGAIQGKSYDILGPSQAPDSAQGLTNLVANLNVPLFSGFRVSSNVRRAERAEDAAIVGIRQARKDTALAVARTYWSVRRIELQREVQLQALERLKEAETVAQARVNAGLAPPIDRNRARLRRLQQTATLADLVGQEREAVAQFAVSIGAVGEVELSDPLDLPQRPPASVDALVDNARHDRPEVESARLQLQIQEQVIRMAKSSYYPQLNVFGLFQYGNNQFNPAVQARAASSSANPFANLTASLTMGASLSMNFFDTFNTYTSVKDATYEQSRLSAEHRRWERIVEADVRSTYERLRKLYEVRAPRQEALEVARDNLAILQGRYQNGEALVIEYLDAQIDLVNAEVQLADIQAQMQIAHFELEASLGRVVGVDPGEAP